MYVTICSKTSWNHFLTDALRRSELWRCFRYGCLKVFPQLLQIFMIFPLHRWIVMAKNTQHIFSNIFIHRRLKKMEDYCFMGMVSQRIEFFALRTILFGSDVFLKEKSSRDYSFVCSVCPVDYVLYVGLVYQILVIKSTRKVKLVNHMKKQINTKRILSTILRDCSDFFESHLVFS